MDSSEIIKKFIVDNFLFGNSNNFDNDTDIFEKGILDSTGIIELVSFVEETFNISLTNDEILDIDCLEKAKEIIKKKLNH